MFLYPALELEDNIDANKKANKEFKHINDNGYC
jgi:hypothetical protein